MRRALACAFVVATLLCANAARAQDADWPDESKALLEQAMEQPRAHTVETLNPQFVPTRDGRSYAVIWQPTILPPQKWLVSLTGTGGYATEELAIWSPALRNKNIGFIGLQWWLGSGDTTRDYYTPFEIYRELDQLLSSLNIRRDTAMLHGFSRGSANIYAVAALDRNRGRHYFKYIIANAGQANMGYPPTRLVEQGEFGPAPFQDTIWITSCGARDPNPERDGCPAMDRTANWIEQKGGSIAMRIADPAGGHGALTTNLKNAARVLDWYSAQ